MVNPSFTLSTLFAVLAVTPYAAGQRAEIQGKFKVLTYNVAGLPGFISRSDPRKNSPIIGERLDQFDIVNVQEDFSYDRQLTSKLKLKHRSPFSGNVIFGDGLRTFSKFPIQHYEKHKWSACHINAADCLTPKGYSVARVEIAKGVTVDVYNLHADAGDDEKDFKARQKSFEDMNKFINEYSAGNAVLFFGDTNTRYTSKEDPIRELKAKSDLNDVWLELEKGGQAPAHGNRIECKFPVEAGKEDNKCELIDKIFYRSSPYLRLKPISYKNENSKFLTKTGGPLSDHFPLSTEFEFEVNPSIRMSEDSIGGEGKGKPFNSIYDNRAAFDKIQPPISSVALRGGSRVDAILYSKDGSDKVITHGGNGGALTNVLGINRAEGEFFNEVEACDGKHDKKTMVFYLRVQTNKGKKVETGTKNKDAKCHTWKARADNWGLIGFGGRSSGELDQIHVFWGRVKD